MEKTDGELSLSHHQDTNTVELPTKQSWLGAHNETQNCVGKSRLVKEKPKPFTAAFKWGHLVTAQQHLCLLGVQSINAWTCLNYWFSLQACMHLLLLHAPATLAHSQPMEDRSASAEL